MFGAQWWDRYQQTLNEDAQWRAASRWVDARVLFVVDDEPVAGLEVRQGRALGVQFGFPAAVQTLC